MTVAPIVDARPSAAQAIVVIREGLASRATPGAYLVDGPVPAAYIERASARLQELSVELFIGGWDLEGDAALRFADRLDETAELARILRPRSAS